MSNIYNDPTIQKEEPAAAGIFTGSPIEIEEQPAFPSAEYEARLGTKFCACCCDYRRATIIMDVIVVTLLIIYLAAIQSDYWYSDYYDSEKWDDHFHDFRVTISILLTVCIITTCLAILGAIQYSVFLVGLGALSLLVTYIVDTVMLINLCNDWNDLNDSNGEPYSDCEVSEDEIAFRFLLTVFFIYPNVGFIVQVFRGFMSPATYGRERTGCC